MYHSLASFKPHGEKRVCHAYLMFLDVNVGKVSACLSLDTLFLQLREFVTEFLDEQSDKAFETSSFHPPHSAISCRAYGHPRLRVFQYCSLPVTITYA